MQGKPPVSLPARRPRDRRVPITLSGTTLPDSSGELVGIDAGVLYLRSERQIAEASPVEVAFPQVKISGIVAACQRAEPDWVVSVAMTPGRRRLERVPIGEDTMVAVVENGTAELRRARIVDASSSGLGLSLSRAIPVNTRVCVETAASMLFGEVRYCRPVKDGTFSAGLRIVEVIPDVRTQSTFSVMLANLRWRVGTRLAAVIRGREVPVYRADR